MLVEYIKVKNQCVGCVVALNHEMVGWSQCNLDKDIFDTEMARDIASGRALKGTTKIPNKAIRCGIKRMQYRASKYFKQPASEQKNSKPFFQRCYKNVFN